MSSKTQKNPSIRFKGFTDAWEQRELKEILKVNSGRDYKHLGSGSIPVYGTGGYMLSVNDKLSDKDAIGIGRKGTIDKPQYLKAPFWTVDTLFFMIPLNNFDLQFLYTMAQKINWKKMDESTGVPSLSKAVIEKVNQNIPSYQEQIKIGGFFKQLDNTIALHQRQLNKYNDLKLTMLQKMFPNNDERAPQVRFDGFTGDWERRKFGDLWRKSSERNNDLKYSSQNVLSVAQMKLNPVERNSTDDYMKTYNVLYYGDIAFEGNKSKNYSFGRFVLNDVQDGIVSHVFISFRPKVEMNIDFMKIYINNENVMKHHLVKATTKTLMMTTLNVHDMNKQFLVIPNIDEQAKIGMFFKKLDDNIALHQKKINNYNCLKKSFLQGMFV